MRKTKAHPHLSAEPTEAEIQKVAYQLWQEAGCPEGRDLEHWLAAKEWLRHRTAIPGRAPLVAPLPPPPVSV